MLLEFFNKCGCINQVNKIEVMPGIKIYHLHAQEFTYQYFDSEASNFEALFCFSGTLMLGRTKHSPIRITKNEIFLLSGAKNIQTAKTINSFNGILVHIDKEKVRNSYMEISSFFTSFPLHNDVVHNFMEMNNGCFLLSDTLMNKVIFDALETLSLQEQLPYCIIKTMDILYLLCSNNHLVEFTNNISFEETYLTGVVSKMKKYMEEHLDRKLTISLMSYQFNISPTAFKTCFRHLYGVPVHKWLQEKRITRAAHLLCSTPDTVLDIAHSVGYESLSQFNLVFKEKYGTTPYKYRKMSETGIL